MTYTDPSPSTQPVPPAAPPRKRHPFRKWLLIASAVFVAVFAVAIILTAALSSAVNHAANPVARHSTSAVPTQSYDTPAPAQTGPDMLTAGQAETIADDSNTTIGTVTVESARVTTWPAQAYGSKPANGYFVVVHVTAAADPAYTSGWDINELDFHALARGTHYDSGNGNAYDALADSQSNADLTATLAAGETSSGWMAFDVPSPHGQIVYAPNLDGQPVAEWSY